MPSWGEIVARQSDGALNLDALREDAVLRLSTYRKRNVICYYSGWLQGAIDQDIMICDNDMNGLMNAIRGMDRSTGLDLVLHTPGGDVAATEAIVSYIKDCFGDDVCAIVPQLAMSAGTMIACSCKSVLMGKQSSLGPTDPQLNGVAAGGVVEEFELAVREAEENPASAQLWAQIIGKYHPTFLGDCKKALDMSKSVVGKWLRSNMFKDRESDAGPVIDLLCSHEHSAMHNRHFAHAKLSDPGMNIQMIEDDHELQDLVLTVHHAFMITFQSARCSKIIQGSSPKNSCWIINNSQIAQ